MNSTAWSTEGKNMTYTNCGINGLKREWEFIRTHTPKLLFETSSKTAWEERECERKSERERERTREPGKQAFI